MTKHDSTAARRLDALSTQLRAAALEVVWRQWRAVGGQVATKEIARSIIDPEALVMLSLSLLHEEHRLVDVLHDWTLLNSDLLSVQRLKNLAASYPETARQRLGALAKIAWRDGKDLRWRSLADEGRSGSRVFSSARTAKSRAIRVRLDDHTTLMFRLRLGFGVGAKADVLGFLLTTAEIEASVRDISEALGYTVAAVRRVADDMAAARLLQTSDRQPILFRADPKAWEKALALPVDLPAWCNWHQRFVFVADFLGWAESVRKKELTPYVLGAKGRELLEAHRPAFERGQLTEWTEHSAIADLAAYVEHAVRSLATWMILHA